MKIPRGFAAREGTAPEPYTNTGWAQEIRDKQTGMEFVFIPAGRFMMGTPEHQRAAIKKWCPPNKQGFADWTLSHEISLLSQRYLNRINWL
jgi:formylglycine-generating enzyme required for sulfatase activity